MKLLRSAADRLRFLWNGPDDLPRNLKLEWRFVAVRWLGIARYQREQAQEAASRYRALAGRSEDLQRAYSELATAHRELLSIDEMKTNFLANLSHELRTPLTSIRSFSELLMEYEDAPDTQKEFLRIISTEAERLTRLVDDVLDVSRIEAGHVNWQMCSVDVCELLADLGRTFGPLISLAQLCFQTTIEHDLSRVYGDRDRLNQVIANLLNNAMKFTRPGATIELRGESTAGEVCISVRATGVSVALEDQERICEHHHDIIEHHHGRMWVESTPGAGSTFTVALPRESRVLASAA